jgi:hypothetical protein
LVVLIVAIPMLYGGGIGVVFTLQAHDPTALIVHAGLYDYLWWLSSVLVSAISSGFLTLAHQWPAMLAARSERMLRINSVFLPVYEIAIMLPVIIGFTGLLLLSNLGPTTWSRRGSAGRVAGYPRHRGARSRARTGAGHRTSRRWRALRSCSHTRLLDRPDGRCPAEATLDSLEESR